MTRARTIERRFFASVAALVVLVGLVIPGLWSVYVESLGPLDLVSWSRGSTVVSDREGRLLRAFTTADGRWRLPLRAREVDPRYLRLLFAYEDSRFTWHHGVDWIAMGRAATQFARNGRVVSGGSTLTMQVARLMEPRDKRNLPAKLRQLARARQLEELLDKEEVLDRYVSLAPFGGNLVGVRAASLAYFGREPRRLSLGEAALLVALPQYPEGRRPERFPEAARIARDRVLDRAVSRGVLTLVEAEAAKSEPVPHERRALPALAAHATEEAVAADPQSRDIKLSLDARLQARLETVAREATRRLGPRLTAAIVVVDNQSGQIRARIGASDYFDAGRDGSVDMSRALRSPGSSLKPFIYALAFEEGVAHPETLLADRPARYGAYTPENFDLGFQGVVSARKALQMSLNLPAVEVLANIGPAGFLARLRGAGAEIALPKNTPIGLAIGLGGLGISPIDLARLYAGIARGGEAPALIERLDGKPPIIGPRRVTDPVAAWYIQDILRGSPPPAGSPYGRIAFKTGTSYGFRDALAVGFDRTTTIAVWIGRADNAPTPGLVGREAAAPILFDAFARLGHEPEYLKPPKGVLKASSAAELPPPLRHLRRDAPKTVAAAGQAPLKIAYPPDGARIDLGLLTGEHDANLALKAFGGAAPLTWFVNGAPVGEPTPRRQSAWRPDGAGFARVTVVDALGASDSAVVRIE